MCYGPHGYINVPYQSITSSIPTKCTQYCVHLVGIEEVIDCKNARSGKLKQKYNFTFSVLGQLHH